MILLNRKDNIMKTFSLNPSFILKYIFTPIIISLLFSSIVFSSSNIAKFATFLFFVSVFVFLVFYHLRFTNRDKIFMFFFILVSLSCIDIHLGFPGYKNLAFSLPFFLMVIFFIKTRLSVNILSTNKNNNLPKRYKILFFIIIITGFITSYFNDVSYYPVFNACVLPFLIMYLCFSYIQNQDEAKLLIIASNIGVLGLLFIIFFAFSTGFATEIARSHEYIGQFSASVRMGAYEFELYPTEFGVLLAMIIPSVIIYFFQEINSKKRFWLGIIIFIYFSLLISVASRGATIAVIISILLILTLSLIYIKRKKGNYKFVIIIFILFILIFISFNIFSKNLSSHTIFRFNEMINYKLRAYNAQGRINLMINALAKEGNGIIGIGFNTLWDKYRIDESNLYSWLSNGIGLIGIFAFLFLILNILYQYLSIIFSSGIRNKYNEIIGIVTLIGVLLSSVSSNYILNRPSFTIPFCVIIGATLKLTYLKRKRFDE